jgi:hypothetical protein
MSDRTVDLKSLPPLNSPLVPQTYSNSYSYSACDPRMINVVCDLGIQVFPLC